jgi:hypothetical protein
MTSFSSRARQRRRRRTYWLLGIAVVLIGVAYGVVQAQGESELTREYLDAAMEVAQGGRAAADTFGMTITDLESIQRAVMIDRVDSLEARLGELTALLEDASPPDGLERGHLFLQIASSSWRNGMATARQGLVEVSDNPLDEEAQALLAEGLVDMRVGDSAYRGFLSEMVGVDTTLQGGPFPAVTFIPDEDAALFDPREIARRLFVTPGLTTETNLAVADLKLEPGPVGESEGIPVIPAGSSLTAEVTVSNRGNTDAELVTVVLDLVSDTAAPARSRQVINSLASGALTTLVFRDLPVEPGGRYEVIATIEQADDDATDNVVRMLFSVNPEG